VYHGTLLAVDAIRRARPDKPAAIEKALKSTRMVSRQGGSYALDDQNHPHTPLFIVGLQGSKLAVSATEYAARPNPARGAAQVHFALAKATRHRPSRGYSETCVITRLRR
jgi:hypothetical protein